VLIVYGRVWDEIYGSSVLSDIGQRDAAAHFLYSLAALRVATDDFLTTT